MFIKHRPYGAFYYYSESIVTFSMTLFLKTFILKGSERKKERGKENSRAPCSSLFADLSVFNVSFTEPPSKKKKKDVHNSIYCQEKPSWQTNDVSDSRETGSEKERQREREKGNKEVKRYRQSHKEQPRNLSINVLSHQTPIRSSWQESCQSRRHTALYEWSQRRTGSMLHMPV